MTHWLLVGVAVGCVLAIVAGLAARRWLTREPPATYAEDPAALTNQTNEMIQGREDGKSAK